MAWSLMCMTVQAVPVKPGVRTHVQSDGTTLRVEPVGDEWFRAAVTAGEGLTVARGADGDYYYRTAAGLTSVLAHNKEHRSASETAFVNNTKLSVEALSQNDALTAQRARRVSPPRRVGSTQVPVTGSPRVPIILVQFQDKKMANTKADFVTQYTSGEKSAFNYFKDQSNGKYTPQYDVYGIYTLNSNRSVYGGNEDPYDPDSSDKGVARMVGEAIDKAGNDIDWSLYDNDNDGEADVCVVVYAGVGEAQAYGLVLDAVWPCQWSLSSGAYYGDGSGTRTRNGKTIDRFAVFNELTGDDDDGTQIDGVGTFCHEFSHCLGLPDFYETTYKYGYYGMGDWSLMDHGCYNDNGYTPIGYSAYEKSFMGWVTLKTPVAGKHYNLPAWNSKNADTDVAYKIVSPKTSNEYFILENRRKQGWDAFITDEGMLIEHVSYISSRWSNNTVNNQSVQLMTVVPADGELTTETQNADCFGETNHEFTDYSTPAAFLNMSSSTTASGNAGLLGKPVTDIYIKSDGTVGFWYVKPDGIPTLEVPVLAEATDVQSTSFTAQWQHNAAVSSTYSLELIQLVAPELLLEETFAKCTAAGTSDISSSLDNVTDVAGWTGSKVFKAQGGLKLGSNQYTGTLVSPVIDAGNHEKVSLKFKAKANGSSTNVGLTVAYGSQSTEITLPSNTEVEYVVVFDKEVAKSVSFATKAKRKTAVVTQVQVYGGDVTQQSDAQPLLTINGITEKQYTVTGLEAGATYDFRVKAYPVDEQAAAESEWSNVQTVTLLEGYKRGDVNGDGSVDIADLTMLVNILLDEPVDAGAMQRAHINDDEGVDIADLTVLVNILLEQE
ncbi:MAG: M6 family metalloprotease domain-containing protein [Muribaculaceae bacterium]|nr:M6 family metalloprotease domain-containing protein [Muribaculaceae bacterium]